MRELRKTDIILSQDEFARVGAFYAKPWLREAHDAIFELISLCESGAQKELIFDLLDRFVYFYEQDISNCVDYFFSHCIPIWALSTADTVIAPLHNDIRADSSQAVLHRISNEMKKPGKVRLDDYNSAFRAAHAHNAQKIVLVDEFVGSGDQAISVVKSLREHLDKHKIESTLFIFSYTAMGRSKSRVSPLVADFEAARWMKRGISDFNSFTQRKKLISEMKEIETKLAKTGFLNGRPRKLYSLGYRQAEALFKNHSSSTPNNVFPIFHWPWLSDGSERQTVLTPA